MQVICNTIIIFVLDSQYNHLQNTLLILKNVYYNQNRIVLYCYIDRKPEFKMCMLKL